MNVIDQIASEPQPKDQVTMRTGRIRYAVEDVVLRIGSRENSYVIATREETFREEPYTRTERVQFGIAGWGDMVRLGACTADRPAVAAS